MRTFLPITGPGGRALTPKERVALGVLAFTLILCVLTLLAGERAFFATEAQNPIFALAAIPSRLLGGGILAFYALVLIWSGLLYLKGEKVVQLGSLPGRLFAAFGVAIGVSGALGIAELTTAGAMGNLVGGAVGNTLGGAVGHFVLLVLGLLGLSLAAQGSWAAMRGAPVAVAEGSSTGGGGAGFAEPIDEQARLRGAGEPPLPDDGDPSPEARTLAVTQAMEEIERSQGVRIVDFEESETESIGESVDAAPAAGEETEEGEVQAGLREVQSLLDSVRPPEPEVRTYVYPVTKTDEDPETEPETETYEMAVSGAQEEGDAHAEADDEEEDEEEPEHGFSIVEEADTIEEEDEEEEEEEPDEESQADGDVYVRVTYSETPPVENETEEAVEEALPEEAAEVPEEEEDDPYARPRLFDRVLEEEEMPRADRGRPYASFDWRGRPLD